MCAPHFCALSGVQTGPICEWFLLIFYSANICAYFGLTMCLEEKSSEMVFVYYLLVSGNKGLSDQGP